MTTSRLFRRLAAAASYCALALSAHAQAPAVQPAAPAASAAPDVWPPPRPPAPVPTAQQLAAVDITRDVIYGHKDGMALTYDVFKPKAANGAIVVNMISGSWFSRWAKAEDRVVGYQPLLNAGFTVVALHHGSAPRFKVPDAAEDVRLGVRHVKAHAKDYGADPARIGVWGASAGGHLALVAGLMSDEGDPKADDALLRGSNRVKTVVAYYPPTDMRLFISRKGASARSAALDYDDKLAEGISPLLAVDAKDPPTLIITGDADKTVDVKNSDLIHAAFDKAGVENKLVIFPGADHGFAIADAAKQKEYSASAAKQMVDWFKSHL